MFRRRYILAIIALLCPGCATTQPAGLEMFRHNWRLAERIEDSADERAISDAQAEVLRALDTLKTVLRENSTAAEGDRAELAGMILGGISSVAPFPESFSNPERLEQDMGRLLREASDAPTWLLMQFQETLEGRANPDGMDPVRRAILDNEIRVRQDARRRR